MKSADIDMLNKTIREQKAIRVGISRFLLIMLPCSVIIALQPIRKSKPSLICRPNVPHVPLQLLGLLDHICDHCHHQCLGHLVLVRILGCRQGPIVS